MNPMMLQEIMKKLRAQGGQGQGAPPLPGMPQGMTPQGGGAPPGGSPMQLAQGPGSPPPGPMGGGGPSPMPMGGGGSPGGTPDQFMPHPEIEKMIAPQMGAQMHPMVKAIMEKMGLLNMLRNRSNATLGDANQLY